KLNPSGQVPCLLVDGRALSESTAILEWLEEAYPATPLLPKDPWVRAEVRSFSQMIACGIQPLANLKVQQFVSKEAEKKTEWSNHFVTEGLVPIETMLRKYSNEGKAFAFGPEPTMADLYLVPQVYNALRVNVDMTRFPLAKQVYDNALKTKACDAAAPHSQEGAQ
ncbi:MAG: maleylacetoacetate isomerase, partial [Proteobacteria bacterium]